jgi:hypothetical protein
MLQDTERGRIEIMSWKIGFSSGVFFALFMAKHVRGGMHSHAISTKHFPAGVTGRACLVLQHIVVLSSHAHFDHMALDGVRVYAITDV